jgi:hypothetical protein
MNKKHFNVIAKDEKEQKIDEIVSKKIISHLYDFFKLNINNKTRKYSKRNNKKTRKI